MYWVMGRPEDEQKPKDGQRDCLARVNGPKKKVKNNRSVVFLDKSSHLGRALAR